LDRTGQAQIKSGIVKMVKDAIDKKPGLSARFTEKKRWVVKRAGKKVIYRLARFMANQSQVENTPIIPHKQFGFLKQFTDHWQDIAAEARQVLKFRDEIPAFQEVSRDQHRIAKAKNWRTFILYGFGQKMEKNAQMAPVTTRLLERIPTLQTAWFSILAPGYHIPAHTGVSKGILRVHLGLIIPKDREKCRIRVGDQIVAWREGEIFVFDDTYNHEVWNDTDEERVILLFDFDRPMKWPGRLVNKILLAGMKRTAFFQEPKKNMQGFQDRFEAAVQRAANNLEKISDRSNPK
jgi:beta-hydroxylase